MNAPHPIRALHGHLAAVAPSLDALPPAGPVVDLYAMGLLAAGLSALTQATFAVEHAVASVEQAVGRGVGQRADLDTLADLAGRLDDAALAVQTATARLTGKLVGAS